MKRLEIVIRGDVQGVNFRNETERKARTLGLIGEVWNASDGSVRIVTEGTEAGLRELLEWSREGPVRARVEGRDVRWSAAVGGFGDFAVRR